MSGEETRRVCAEVRDALLELIGDPNIPPWWRGRAMGLLSERAEEGETVMAAQWLARAAARLRRLCVRVERLLGEARETPAGGEAAWLVEVA